MAWMERSGGENEWRNAVKAGKRPVEFYGDFVLRARSRHPVDLRARNV